MHFAYSIVHNYTVRAGYIRSCISFNYKNAAGASVVTEAMTTSNESICCSEVDRVVEKKEGGSAVSCIIDHKGFHSVCLDVWVLQTAYFNYQQHYGVAEEKAVHE